MDVRSVFVFAVFSLSSGQPVRTSCPLTVSPGGLVVRFGGSLSAQCSSSSAQTEGMGWESPAGGTALTLGVTSLPLNITQVTIWKLNPICFVNIRGSSQCSKQLPVTVYKMPDSVSLLQTKGNMVEGGSYRLVCDVVNVAPARNVTVTWLRGDGIVSTESFNVPTLSPLNVSSVLNLTAHRSHHGTQIRCSAKFNFGPAGPDLPRTESKPVALRVLYPPAFTESNQTLSLPAGGQITLNCTASGNPTPVYSWHLPQPAQQLNGDHGVNEATLTPSFPVPGTYSCTASNDMGFSTKQFTVTNAPRTQTTFAAVVGAFVSLGVLIVIGGIFFVTADGTFSCSKDVYVRGRPTSGPV